MNNEAYKSSTASSFYAFFKGQNLYFSQTT